MNEKMKVLANCRQGMALAILLLALVAAPALAGEGAEADHYVVFTAEQVQHLTLPQLDGPYWTPTPEVIAEVERRLPGYVNIYAPKYNTKLKGDLAQYKRQYLGYTLAGRKMVYVNAFCEDFDRWRHAFIWVYGGGECFFQVSYDPQAKMFFMFTINGEL